MLWNSNRATRAAPWRAAPTAAGRVRRAAGVPTILVGAWCLASIPVVGFGRTSTTIPVKVYRYAGHLVEKYDADGDGRLQPVEWQRMDGNPAVADGDGDGVIEVEELSRYIADYGAVRRIRLMPSMAQAAERFPSLLSEGLVTGGPADRSGQSTARSADEPSGDPAGSPASDSPSLPSQRRFTVNPSRLPPGLPAWFLRLDSDGDGQLTQSEFTPTGSPAALLEFDAFDHNGDGIMTAKEAAAGARRPPDAGQDELRSPAS